MASFAVRNYIIELDHADTLTQYRKLFNFNHPKRGIQFTKKAVLVMPTDAEYRRRLRQRAEQGNPVSEELIKKRKALFRLPTGRKVTMLKPELNQIEKVNRLEKVPPQIFEEVELFEEVIYTELDGPNAHSLAYQYIEDCRRSGGMVPTPPVNMKMKQEKKTPPNMKDNWVHSTDVMLDKYNSDLNMQISPDGLSCAPLTQEGFRYMWAGVRANYGVSNGKVAYQIKVVRKAQMNKDQPDMQDSHVGRVGWSTDDAHLQLGEQPKSFGYGGTAKWSVNGRFQDFHQKYSIGDVVTCYMDLTDRTRVIFSYSVNDGPIRPAPSPIQRYQFDNQPLFPHICSKNLEISVYFGAQESEPYFPLRDNSYRWIGEIPPGNRVRGLKPPHVSEREALFMIGLPGAGKTHWALQEQKNKPEKRYNILGLNLIIDKMKIIGLGRKGNYKGRWEILLDKANYCLNYLLENVQHTNRNYILDQTNVYSAARRKKQKVFQGFRKVAVVVLPTEEDFRVRFLKMTMKEGEKVPEAILNQMKSNFALPDGVEVKVLNKALNERFAEEHRRELAEFSNVKTWRPDPNMRFEELIYTDLALENARYLVHKYKQEGLAANSNVPKEIRKLDEQRRKATSKQFLEAAHRQTIPHRPAPSNQQSSNSALYHSVPDFYKYEDRSDEKQDVQLSSAINQGYNWSQGTSMRGRNQAPFATGNNFNQASHSNQDKWFPKPNRDFNKPEQNHSAGKVKPIPSINNSSPITFPTTSNWNQGSNTGGNNWNKQNVVNMNNMSGEQRNHFGSPPMSGGNSWGGPQTSGDNYSSPKQGGDNWNNQNVVNMNNMSGEQRNNFGSPPMSSGKSWSGPQTGGDNYSSPQQGGDSRRHNRGNRNTWNDEQKDSGYGSQSSYEQTPQNSWNQQSKPLLNNYSNPNNNSERQDYAKWNTTPKPDFNQSQQKAQPIFGSNPYSSTPHSSAPSTGHNDRRTGFDQPPTRGYGQTYGERVTTHEKDQQRLNATFNSPNQSYNDRNTPKAEHGYDNRALQSTGDYARNAGQSSHQNYGSLPEIKHPAERQAGGSYGQTSLPDRQQSYNYGNSTAVFDQKPQATPQGSNNLWHQDGTKASSYGGHSSTGQFGHNPEPPKPAGSYPSSSMEAYNQPSQSTNPWSSQNPTQAYENYGSQSRQPYQQIAEPTNQSYGSQQGQNYQQNSGQNVGYGQTNPYNSAQPSSYPGYAGNNSNQPRSQQRW